MFRIFDQHLYHLSSSLVDFAAVVSKFEIDCCQSHFVYKLINSKKIEGNGKASKEHKEVQPICDTLMI